jgi:hypothetical protein
MRLKSFLLGVAATGAIGGLFLGNAQAIGGAIPQFNAATMLFSHDASTTDGAAGIIDAPLPVFSNTTSPGLSYNQTQFGAGGANASSLGRIGMGWTSTSSKTAVTWASNMGVSQSDPAPNNGAATMQVKWNVSWLIPSGSGTFGPPVSTSFNIPVGGTVGAGGLAQFSLTVTWYVFRATGGAPEILRTYNDGNSWGPGSFFQTFSAGASALNTVFNPGDAVGISGALNFLADNEFDPDTGMASPVTIQTPFYSTNENEPFVPNFNDDPNNVSGFFAAVPLPASAKAGLVLLGGLAVYGGIRRRRALVNA